MTTNYEKYPHYFKRIPEGMTHLDVYAVLQLFGVTDQATGHAIKKLLVPGVRGTKSKAQDIQEAIDTLERWKQLNKEFEPKAAEPAEPTDNYIRHTKLGVPAYTNLCFEVSTCPGPKPKKPRPAPDDGYDD